MSHSVYAYPWCHRSSDTDHLLARLRELGVDSTTLATSYHAGKFLHPTQPGNKVYFPEDGTTYFLPRLKYGTIKPTPSRFTKRDDILRTLVDRADTAINAWTVLFHNFRLGQLHPSCTVRNAYDNSYAYSLCPANPSVREYGVTLCSDLTEHYSLQQLLLETPGYLPYNHGFHHEFSQVPPDQRLEAWLGLCFCEHCIRGARDVGIDAEELKRQAIDEVEAALSSDEPLDPAESREWFEREFAQNSELNAFIDWRCDVVSSLVAEIRERVRGDVKVKVIATTQRPHATAFWEGHDLHELDRVSDGLELPLYQPDVAAVLDDLRYVISQVGNAENLSAILRPGWPDMRSEAQLIETVQKVRAKGIANISFYNFDMLLPANLEWLRRAIVS